MDLELEGLSAVATGAGSNVGRAGALLYPVSSIRTNASRDFGELTSSSTTDSIESKRSF